MTPKPSVGVAVMALVLGFVSSGSTPVLAQSQATATFVNAKVMSLDAQNRLMKVRLPDGTEQTAELDDNVAGFGDVAAGDNVVLSMRNEPGRPRVSAIVKGGASAPAPVSVSVVPRPATTLAPTAGALVDPVETAYVTKLTDAASRADSVDREWSQFKTNCKADESAAYEGARPWLLLWENAQAADLSGGFCRDLFNQIVSHGTTISTTVAAADSEARRSLSPERMREIRQVYSLDWSGWGTPPPKLLAQP